MIELTYLELYKIDRLEARRILLKTYREKGQNFLRTAKALGCSRNTVKKYVKREASGQSLDDLPKRPKCSPRQILWELKEKVIKERKKTNFGRVRLAKHLQTRFGISIPSSTIRNIFARHKLTSQQKRRGRFRAVTFYDWDRIYPLQHFQIDLKEILDIKTLPHEAYVHLLAHIGKGLPAYQWRRN